MEQISRKKRMKIAHSLTTRGFIDAVLIQVYFISSFSDIIYLSVS
jgi:hypothetical protein